MSMMTRVYPQEHQMLNNQPCQFHPLFSKMTWINGMIDLPRQFKRDRPSKEDTMLNLRLTQLQSILILKTLQPPSIPAVFTPLSDSYSHLQWEMHKGYPQWTDKLIKWTKVMLAQNTSALWRDVRAVNQQTPLQTWILITREMQQSSNISYRIMTTLQASQIFPLWTLAWNCVGTRTRRLSILRSHLCTRPRNHSTQTTASFTITKVTKLTWL